MRKDLNPINPFRPMDKDREVIIITKGKPKKPKPELVDLDELLKEVKRIKKQKSGIYRRYKER
jgi:hypothetical protein